MSKSQLKHKHLLLKKSKKISVQRHFVNSKQYNAMHNIQLLLPHYSYTLSPHFNVPAGYLNLSAMVVKFFADSHSSRQGGRDLAVFCGLVLRSLC